MLQTTVIGHLGNDAVVKEVNGKKVIDFSVAHTEKFKSADGVLRERTTWVDCGYWNESASVAPYLKKGGMVYVQGSPNVETYLAKDGVTKASFRLRVANLQLLGSAKQEGQQRPAGQSGAGITAAEGIGETLDDLPF